jgi:hypothetical protein
VTVLLLCACGAVANDGPTVDGGAHADGEGVADSSSDAVSAPVDGAVSDRTAPPDVSVPDATPRDASDEPPTEGDASDPECVALSKMTLTNVTWSAAAIAPGDQPTVTITLTNNGSDDTNYPGIRVSSDNPAVTATPPENNLFGIFAGTSNQLSFVVTFGGSLSSGTTIHFRAEASSLHHAPCPNAGATTFDVTLS